MSDLIVDVEAVEEIIVTLTEVDEGVTGDVEVVEEIIVTIEEVTP